MCQRRNVRESSDDSVGTRVTPAIYAARARFATSRVVKTKSTDVFEWASDRDSVMPLSFPRIRNRLCE